MKFDSDTVLFGCIFDTNVLEASFLVMARNQRHVWSPFFDDWRFVIWCSFRCFSFSPVFSWFCFYVVQCILMAVTWCRRISGLIRKCVLLLVICPLYSRQCAAMNSAKSSLATQQAVVETFLRNYDGVCNNHFSCCINESEIESSKDLWSCASPWNDWSDNFIVNGCLYYQNSPGLPTSDLAFISLPTWNSYWTWLHTQCLSWYQCRLCFYSGNRHLASNGEESADCPHLQSVGENTHEGWSLWEGCREFQRGNRTAGTKFDLRRMFLYVWPKGPYQSGWFLSLNHTHLHL